MTKRSVVVAEWVYKVIGDNLPPGAVMGRVSTHGLLVSLDGQEPTISIRVVEPPMPESVLWTCEGCGNETDGKMHTVEVPGGYPDGVGVVILCEQCYAETDD